MNAAELAANPILTGGLVQDLNRAPWLPFGDGVFDACLLTVSVQYLIKPVQVFAEVARVLCPRAPTIVSYSNRCFPTKATAVWRALDASGHAQLISSYFAHSAGFEPARTEIVTPPGGAGDPLYVVRAKRLRRPD
jgi:SAM-dependent methyltransferase